MLFGEHSKKIRMGVESFFLIKKRKEEIKKYFLFPEKKINFIFFACCAINLFDDICPFSGGRNLNLFLNLNLLVGFNLCLK